MTAAARPQPQVHRPGDSTQRRFCWLASFPKSGNTWTRILLANLTNPQGNAQDLSRINLEGFISSSRPLFDTLTGLPSSDMTDDEIDLLRADAYRMIAAEGTEPMFVKVHDAYHCDTGGRPIFPAECSIGAIYLVRDPRDVAVSYAHHMGLGDFEKSVRRVNAVRHDLAGGNRAQLRQRVAGWSSHYNSWHDQDAIRLLTIRFEDMIADSAACLTAMAEFLGLEQAGDAAAIEAAVAAARFETLRAREEEGGFRERPERAHRFFRSGRTGEGRECLSAEQQQAIRDANGPLMERLGYD